MHNRTRIQIITGMISIHNKNQIKTKPKRKRNARNTNQNYHQHQYRFNPEMASQLPRPIWHPKYMNIVMYGEIVSYEYSNKIIIGGEIIPDRVHFDHESYFQLFFYTKHSRNIKFKKLKLPKKVKYKVGHSPENINTLLAFDIQIYHENVPSSIFRGIQKHLKYKIFSTKKFSSNKKKIKEK